MILSIENLLSGTQIQDIRSRLDNAQWVGGEQTAGTQAIGVKHNQQVDGQDAQGRHCAEMILGALAQHPTFISAALPLKIYPPLFNHYGIGETYGAHVCPSSYKMAQI